MPDNDPRMVLRTVYLPAALDDELKRRAYQQGASKGDLIRQAVAALLAGQPQ